MRTDNDVQADRAWSPDGDWLAVTDWGPPGTATSAGTFLSTTVQAGRGRRDAGRPTTSESGASASAPTAVASSARDVGTPPRTCANVGLEDRRAARQRRIARYPEHLAERRRRVGRVCPTGRTDRRRQRGYRPTKSRCSLGRPRARSKLRSAATTRRWRSAAATGRSACGTPRQPRDRHAAGPHWRRDRAHFRRDGSQLASTGFDGAVRIWALHLDDLEAIARDNLTRGFTTDECQRYLHVERCP